MILSNMTALTAAIMAIPVLTGIGNMHTPNAGQIPGSCEAVQVNESLSSFQCYGAAVAVHEEDGAQRMSKGRPVYAVQPLPLGMLKGASEDRRGIPAGGIES